MLRSEAIGKIMEEVKDEIVVSNIGDPSKELFSAKDRPRNFYMLGSLGLASSIALGLSLSQNSKVICLDGDGSLLMNLGSLTTIGYYSPKNLILIVLDNGCYGTTGNQKTFTRDNVDLEGIAKKCNIKNSFKITKKNELERALNESIKKDAVSFLHVYIDADLSKLKRIPLNPIEIKERFMSESKN